MINFEKIIKQADIIITGEGQLDYQSMNGKVVSGIIKKGLENNVDCICLCGFNKLSQEEIKRFGLKKVYQILNEEKPIEEIKKNKYIDLESVLNTIKL